MRDYRISQQWPAVEARAVVPYEVFRHRMMDGWSAIDAAMTPARTYTSVMDRLWPLIEATPGITTDALRERCPGLTAEQIYYAVYKNGKLSCRLVAKGANGQRPVYAVEMVKVVPVAPVVTQVVLVRRAPMVDYGSPFARRAP